MISKKTLALLLVSFALICVSGTSGFGQILTGTGIGTAGTYCCGNTFDKALDGNLTTGFDAPTASGSWVGLDLGTARVITQVAYCPRVSQAPRMVGGLFQGSNSADFSGAVTLFTVASTPAEGAMTTQTVSNGTAFRYVRYLGPTNGWCNIAEVAFYGGGSAPAAPTGLGATAGNTQVSLSWTASSGATSYNLYRGTTSNGQNATPVVTGISGTTFTNTGLTNGTAYYYKVKAVNASGTSGYSNEASATPAGGGGGGALTGTGIGTAGTYCCGNTFDQALDGNLTTGFDAPTASGSWVGLDLGTAGVAERVLPYFKRDAVRYCSHLQTPPRPEVSGQPAILAGERFIYFADPIFREYRQSGNIAARDAWKLATRRLIGPAPYGDRLSTTIQVYPRRRGNDLILTLLHYVPVRKALNIDMIEERGSFAGEVLRLPASAKEVRVFGTGEKLAPTADGGFMLPATRGRLLLEVTAYFAEKA